MITKQQDSTILPLDLTSIIGLLEPNGGEFSPLHTTIVQPTPETTEVHINIQQCDSDSIAIDVSPQNIAISADASIRFQTNTNHEGVHLKRPVSTTIPLAPGVDVSNIRSQITDDTLVLTIPLHSL
jgi:hypothetical protein